MRSDLSEYVSGQRNGSRQQQPRSEKAEDGTEPTVEDQTQQSYSHQVRSMENENNYNLTFTLLKVDSLKIWFTDSFADTQEYTQ